MTRHQANRILDAVRYGGAQPTLELITEALRVTGDLDEHGLNERRTWPPAIGVWVENNGFIDLRKGPQ